ncbi:hypothetical protein [Sulfurisoma sediminicola]|uniref:Uncharacterized protein n=1 Tax=Sulfurisoma sediminicola TaxID=1381557 RepID=A0A497XMJ6_9PROT|nr:hypothetical protein [Sulfurisoma sediminicola]RLJ69169.1 hypothetical protein DFR35_0007 [Sulfurisoma sediminicola]
MGLVVFGAMALYFLLSIAVVIGAIVHARKRGRSAAHWGSGAALVMYMLVFWDHIPTVVAHRYYCEKDAGFWVYETLDQWKKENPGVMETLVANKEAPSRDEMFDGGRGTTTTYFINDRFNWLVRVNGPSFPNRWRHEQEVVDGKTGEVLARYIDFSTAQGAYGAGWYGWKFWLRSGHCSGGERNDSRMWQFTKQFKGIEK